MSRDGRATTADNNPNGHYNNRNHSSMGVVVHKRGSMRRVTRRRIPAQQCPHNSHHYMGTSCHCNHRSCDGSCSNQSPHHLRRSLHRRGTSAAQHTWPKQLSRCRGPARRCFRQQRPSRRGPSQKRMPRGQDRKSKWTMRTRNTSLATRPNAACVRNHRCRKGEVDSQDECMRLTSSGHSISASIALASCSHTEPVSRQETTSST